MASGCVEMNVSQEAVGTCPGDPHGRGQTAPLDSRHKSVHGARNGALAHGVLRFVSISTRSGPAEACAACLAGPGKWVAMVGLR